MGCRSYQTELYNAIDENDLQALYCPGLYRQGEQLCVDMLEHHDPESQLALLFWVLNLAALNAEEEALEIVECLDDRSLFKALAQLPFGFGTEAEASVYAVILEMLRDRDLQAELEFFLAQGVLPANLGGLPDSVAVSPFIDELSY